MAGFNRGTVKATGRGPLATAPTPTGTTHEGGPGYQRDAKSELFLRATTMFVGEKAFYESANEGANRLRVLVAEIVKTDEGWEWLKGFLPWLRSEANIRTAGILLSVEAVHARLAYGLHGNGNRELISRVLQRADEPGEVLAYWTSRYGKAIPKPIKRGVADAATRLYSERGFLRYDSDAKSFRFGDVLELTHPETDKVWQKDLFSWAITSRQEREGAEPAETLEAVRLRRELSRLPAERRHEIARGALAGEGTARNDIERAAAGQWEWVISWLGDKPTSGKGLTKAEQWQLILPSLGYMALIRNLRNLDQAELDDVTAGGLATRIANPEHVATSRQLPFRFYSAYKEAPSLRWSHALDRAMSLSLQNVPELTGRSLILIDTSGSMEIPMSNRSDRTRVEAAAIFGLALALKNPESVDVYGFASGEFKVTGVDRGLSLLKAVEAFISQVGRVGHGTDIHGAVQRQFVAGRHDRVFIFTDMQTVGTSGYGYRNNTIAELVPASVPVYGFNLAGYQHSAMPVGEGNRHELGGLGDGTFSLIPQLEAGTTARWPWETTDE